MRKHERHYSLEDICRLEVYSCRSPNLSGKGPRDAGSPKAQNRSSALKECGGSHFVKKKERKKEPEHGEDLSIKRQKSNSQMYYLMPGWGGMGELF